MRLMEGRVKDDMTLERKRAQEILEDSEARYRRLFETAQDGILILDAHSGVITDVNPFLLSLLDYPREEFIGKTLWDIGPFKHIEASKAAFRELQDKEYIRYDDLPLEARGGRCVNVEFVSNVYAVSGKNVIQCNIRDITARKHAEERDERLRQSELQLKDDFLSHVSHELRSPLTAIYQFVTIIADGLAGENSQQQQEFLQIILRNVRQLQSMIDDLLEVSRSQAGKLSIEPQRVSVSDAIGYAVDTLQGAAATKGVVLSFNPSAHLPSVYADPTRLRQILINLLDNAIKFTPSGGAVKVQAQVSEKDPGFLLLEVSDTGCGISPKMIDRIFEHLYQVTDPGQAGRKGLGLGLHISKELVTRHGGEIWVNSKPQKGSHLFFTMPIFSMTSWIGPMILMHDKKPGDAIALLAVEMGSRDGWLSADVRKELSNVARKLLEQCLRPDTDILLPNMDSVSMRELFFVVVYTQKAGAEIINNRILRQFGHREEFQSANLTFDASHAFLAPTSRGVNDSMEIIVERAAAEIQDRINAIYLQRSN